MKKNIYFYSNLFAWGLILLLVGNYVLGWTTPTQNPPEGNIILEAGATPAGSTGYIQFNEAGSLGADSNLFWDNTNKRLGVGTAGPGAMLHVNGPIIASSPTDATHVATKGYVDAAAPRDSVYTYFYSCSSCNSWGNFNNSTCSAPLPPAPACPPGYSLLLNVTNGNQPSALSSGLPLGRLHPLNSINHVYNDPANCTVDFAWPPGYGITLETKNQSKVTNSWAFCNIACHLSFCVSN